MYHLYPVTEITIHGRGNNRVELSGTTYFMDLYGDWSREEIAETVFAEWYKDYFHEPSTFVRPPFTPENVKSFLTNFQRELMRERRKDVAVKNVRILNYLAYHFLDEGFVSVAERALDLGEFIYDIFRRYRSNPKLPKDDINLMIYRMIHLIISNLSLLRPNIIFRKRNLLHILLVNVSENKEREIMDERFNDCQSCILLHSFRSIFNIIIARNKREDVRFSSFLKFFKNYSRGPQKEFILSKFIRETLLPIILRNHTKRKSLSTHKHQYFLYHIYVLLYETIFASMADNLTDFKYLREFANSEKLFVSMQHDLYYFVDRCCSIKKLRQFRNSTENWPSDSSPAAVYLCSRILCTFERFSHRGCCPLKILTERNVRTIVKKIVSIFKVTEKYYSIFPSDEHYKFSELHRQTLKTIRNFLMNSPDVKIRREVLELVYPLIARLSDSLPKIHREYVIKIIPLMSQNYNKDEWETQKWKEFKMTEKCEKIVEQIYFLSDDIDISKPNLPFKEKETVQVLMPCCRIIELVYFLSPKDSIDFLFSEKNQKKKSLFKLILMSYYKGPDHLKFGIATCITALLSQDPFIVQEMKRFFQKYEDKENHYCNILRLLGDLRKSEIRTKVRNHRIMFKRARMYLDNTVLPPNLTNQDIKNFFGVEEEEDDGEHEEIGNNFFTDFGRQWFSGMLDASMNEKEQRRTAGDEIWENEEKKSRVKKKMEEEGLSSAVRDCGWCHNHNAEKKCGRCKIVFYCSSKCQVKHWKVHKNDCK